MTACGATRRAAGVLLHPTSLPGPRNAGNLGAEAYHFVHFLADCGVSVWQTLPLGPTHGDGSPYQCLSSHAGDPRLIDLDWLVARGWLAKEHDTDRGAGFREAWARFQATADAAQRAAFERFCREEADWLEDYALYHALRDHHQGRPWWEWPPAARDRHDTAPLAEALAAELAVHRFEQFVFFEQWHALRAYANRQGIRLFGDMPFFVALDSADVWCAQSLFDLDDAGQPRTVAGVPPDYFAETGQRWGNPQYRWDRMAAEDFDWWVRRFRSQLRLFDCLRIDHFRGFQAVWEIRADEETAINGRWVPVPGEQLFDRVRAVLPALPVVAEDLGYITAEVDELRRRQGFPGMRVLQFGFDGQPGNPHVPHNHQSDMVVYTGTHDNDTTRGWWDSLTPSEQAHVQAYLGQPGDTFPWPLIRAALASVGELAVVPMQDLLGLDAHHRMNTPGTEDVRNWRWRFDWSWVPADLPARFRHLVDLYDRLPAGAEQERHV